MFKCICVVRPEGAMHTNEVCPVGIQIAERQRAADLVTMACKGRVVTRTFEDKAWVSCDSLLDFINEFKKLVVQDTKPVTDEQNVQRS